MTDPRKPYSLGHIRYNVEYLARVLRHKPLFLARLAGNYLRLPFCPDRPPLRFVDIAVTYRCNMRCSHCSATCLAQKGRPELTVDQYRLIGARLRRAGALAVNFTGGEPLLRKDILEVIRAFEPEKLLVAVQTNASLLTRERLRDLKRAGVDSLGISIDGPDAETHDSFRNTPGAYEKAVKGLEMASELGFNVGISYCLTHHNLHSDERRGIVALSRRYGTTLNYNLAVPIGFWAGRFDGLLRPEDRRFLLAELERYPASKTDHETNYFRKGCGAIKEKLYVTAYGDVMPCPFIHVGFGNLLDDEVESIRDRALAYRYFRRYTPHCLAAEDMDFIGNVKCYQPGHDGGQAPLPHEQAFVDRDKAMRC